MFVWRLYPSSIDGTRTAPLRGVQRGQIVSIKELRKPAPRVPIAIGSMEWRDLVYVHWNVDAHTLRPLVPGNLALDLLPDGRAVVSLVAFCAVAARPRGLPRVAGIDFAEVNLRTYVRARGHGRGVYFFSLDAASRVTALGARHALGLPYRHTRVEHFASNGVIGFHARRGIAGASLSLRIEPRLTLGHERGFEQFVHERYAAYWPNKGALRCLSVRHAPLAVVRAQVVELHETLTQALGIDVHRSVPTAYFVEHAAVSIFVPERVAPQHGARDACLAAS
jgi:uncharacterized protein YqjF (DUF2071 family)